MQLMNALSRVNAFLAFRSLQGEQNRSTDERESFSQEKEKESFSKTTIFQPANEIFRKPTSRTWFPDVLITVLLVSLVSLAAINGGQEGLSF